MTELPLSLRTTSIRRLALRALATASSLAALSACNSVEVECLATRGTGLYTTPPQITVAPGDTGIVTAAYPALTFSQCGGPTRTLRNAVIWSSSNPAVATIVPLDSLRARITGVAKGQTTVIAASVDEPSLKAASGVVVP